MVTGVDLEGIAMSNLGVSIRRHREVEAAA